MLYDNHFPNPGSGFVTAEFCHYLDSFPSSVVISRAQSWHSAEFGARQKDFESAFPRLKGRVVRLFGGPALDAPIGYTVFYYQACQLWDMMSKGPGRLAFTLNPGGGFSLTEKACRDGLSRIFASRTFGHVFATQACTAEYLQALGLVEGRDFTFIYGSLNFEQPVEDAERSWYGDNADPLHIGFAGYKYMPGGFDKGFDVFCGIAQIAHRAGRRWRFGCWGTFSASDAPDPELAARLIEFHGPTDHAGLSRQLRGVDVFVSPNRADRLMPGAFDGFPLGTAIQAGKAGAVLLITDPVGLNRGRFANAKDLFLLQADPDPDAAEFFDVIDHLARQPGQLKLVALRGASALGRYFNRSAQLVPRARLLATLMEGVI